MVVAALVAVLLEPAVANAADGVAEEVSVRQAVVVVVVVVVVVCCRPLCWGLTPCCCLSS